MHIFPSQRLNEDVVQSTLTELILFLVFFFLVLLGSYVSVSGALTEVLRTDQEKLSAELQSQQELHRADQVAVSQLTTEGSALKVENVELQDRLVELEELLKGAISAQILLENQAKDLGRQLLSALDESQQLLLENQQLKGLVHEFEFYSESTNSRKEQEVEGLQFELATEQQNTGELRVQIEGLELEIELLELNFVGAASIIIGLKEELAISKRENVAIEAQNNDLVERIAAGSAASEIDWPTSLILADNDGYRFKSGSAALTARFLSSFERDAVPKLNALLSNSQFEIVTIEVIGHTDEETRQSSLHDSNMDAKLIGFLDQGGPLHGQEALKTVDNAGLGMARAATVAALIRQNVGLATELRILPLSAAQLVEADGTLATGRVEDFSNDSRRRIEIRVRGPERRTN